MVSKKKKKKGLYRIWPNLRLIFRPRSEIFTFFPLKIRWSPKKKGLHRFWDCFFGPIRKSKRLREGCFPMEGLFSIFHKKSASKPPKWCGFAYFISQWGGSSPPAPPLATLLIISMFSIFALAIKFDCIFLIIFQSFHLFVSCIFDKLAPPEHMLQKVF